MLGVPYVHSLRWRSTVGSNGDSADGAAEPAELAALTSADVKAFTESVLWDTEQNPRLATLHTICQIIDILQNLSKINMLIHTLTPPKGIEVRDFI